MSGHRHPGPLACLLPVWNLRIGNFIMIKICMTQPSWWTVRPILQSPVEAMLIRFPARPQPRLYLLLPLVETQVEDVRVDSEAVLQVHLSEEKKLISGLNYCPHPRPIRRGPTNKMGDEIILWVPPTPTSSNNVQKNGSIICWLSQKGGQKPSIEMHFPS